MTRITQEWLPDLSEAPIVPLLSEGESDQGCRLTEEQVADAISTALETPINFPGVESCLVQGDQVAIALGDGLNHCPQLIRGAVQALGAAGVTPEHITVVLNDQANAELLKNESLGVNVVLHNPRDEKEHCFLGVNGAEQPLVISRHLFDADFVLPLTQATGPKEGVSASPFQGLFPEFSDQEAQKYYQQLSLKKRRAEVEHVGRLIGAPLSVQVVNGPAGTIAGIFVGTAQEVAFRGEKLAQQVWSRTAPHVASLVIATISGDARQQTWDNVATALSAAGELVDDHGGVVLCTELAEAMKEPLRLLEEEQDPEELRQRLKKTRGGQARAAIEIARARERGPVYFLSQLPEDDLEAVGLVPITDPADLQRLAGRSESCMVVEDLHLTKVAIAPIE